MYFEAFEKKVLLGMQQVLYLSDTTTKSGSRDVITPPPSKLLQMMRTQFVSSVYKAVSGMLENAEAPGRGDEDEWVLVTSLSSIAEGASPAEMLTQDAINVSSRNVRLLLTMSNLKALRNERVPSLIQLFESSFSVKLADESKTIRDVFGQIVVPFLHQTNGRSSDKGCERRYQFSRLGARHHKTRPSQTVCLRRIDVTRHGTH
jgi:exocyst complex component 2